MQPPKKKKKILEETSGKTIISKWDSGQTLYATLLEDSGEKFHHYMTSVGETSEVQVSVVQSKRTGSVEFEIQEKKADGTSVAFKTSSLDQGYRIDKEKDGYSVSNLESAEHRDTNVLTFLFVDNLSSVHCKDSNASVRVSENVLDSVTRDKIQQFALRNPEIAAELEKLDLPIVKTDLGKSMTFAQAVETPSSYKSCPVGKPAVAVERK